MSRPWLSLPVPGFEALTYLAVFLDVLGILIFGKQQTEHDGAASLLPVTEAPTTRKHLRYSVLFLPCLIWYLSEVADCLQPADTRQLACLQLPRRGLDWLVVWHGFLQQRLDKHQTSTLDSHMRQIRQENSVRVESQAVKYSVVKPPPISNHYYYNDYND